MCLSLFYFSYFNLFATTYNWSGSTSGSQAWGTGTNWTPNGTPFTGDTATIDKTSSAATSFTVTMGTQSINSLTLTSGTSGAQVIDMTGGSLAVDNGGEFDLSLGSATSLTVNASSDFGLPTNITFDVPTSTALILSGILSGTGSGFTKRGDGTLALSADNTYTGATIVEGGGLILSHTGFIDDSTSVVVDTGATLTIGGV